MANPLGGQANGGRDNLRRQAPSENDVKDRVYRRHENEAMDE